MFSHIFVGTNDAAAAKTFYDAVFGAYGLKEGFGIKDGAAYVYSDGTANFIVGVPANGEAATFANGGTIGLKAASPEAVDAAYKAGLAAGGTCDGEPGPRAAFPGSYGAYLRDPDNNKICLWHVAA
ncbi:MULTISPECIES: VOC family protein [Novosphingobium]|uniref:VOC family protein n=1 Tax=Novosphingobium decolorationis TaxID=2698673 RepID=A0ABX8DZV3_9SPHN|nr:MULTISPECIES: VOC family protein [Novosphingobium]MED5546466.1 VOC family protein [Pseudomonadota bacterium]QVM82410.1 VOC family protein [Novosphingobium decolorationis]GAM07028.1 glyoxalase [Novosphingobium sp. MBES04]